MKKDIKIVSLDGLRLCGTLEKPKNQCKGSILLVHGLTVDRHEDGFYDLIAEKFLENNYASLRFDLRAHGESEGDYKSFSLSGVMSDIQSCVNRLLEETDTFSCNILAASFGGGLSIWASHLIESKLTSLILLNPLLNYRARFLEEKKFFNGVGLTPSGSRTLRTHGYLKHINFKLSVPFVNELINYRIDQLPKLMVPVLTIHGTRDSMVPYKVAKKYYKHNERSEFISFAGADHGFYHPEDETGDHPVTRENWMLAIRHSINWVQRWVAKNKSFTIRRR